jgi:tripartite-type tricarboxylate transporter receptor subunit TctC
MVKLVDTRDLKSLGPNPAVPVRFRLRAPPETIQLISRRTFVASAAVLAGTTALHAFAQSDQWPNRPIKLIVPFPPGGGNDTLARLLSEQLPPILGQPIIVENKPGVGGNLGTDFVAKQPADGYTLLLSSVNQVVNPSFFPKLPFDTLNDFEPISMIASIPLVLTVHASSPVTTLKEFVAMARAKPGAVTYGSVGNGSIFHLAGEQLKAMAGIDMLHVPYKGSAPLVLALVAGEITCTIGAAQSLLPHIRSGRLRPIAVASGTRTALLPEVPTMADAGPLPGYDILVWFGVLAPRGTPRPVLIRLNTEINRIIRDPEIIRTKMTPVGFEAIGTTPERYTELMKVDLAKYARIAKEAKITLE